MFNVSICYPPFSDNITTVAIDPLASKEEIASAIEEAFDDIGVQLPEGRVVCLEEVESGTMIALNPTILQGVSRSTIHTLVISKKPISSQKASPVKSGKVLARVTPQASSTKNLVTPTGQPPQYIGRQPEPLVANHAYTEEALHAESDFQRKRTAGPTGAEHVELTNLVRKYATRKKALRQSKRFVEPGASTSASEDLNSTQGSQGPGSPHSSAASTPRANGQRVRLVRPKTAPRMRASPSHTGSPSGQTSQDDSGVGTPNSTQSAGSHSPGRSPTINGQPWKPIWERGDDWKRQEIERKMGLSVTAETSKRLEKEYRDSFRPNISDGSRRMMKQQRNHRPLYDRVLDEQAHIKKQREHKEKMAEEQAKEGREVKLSSRSAKLMSSLSGRPKYYEQDFARIQADKEAERERLQSFLGSGEFTRKPRINQKSAQLAASLDRVKLNAKDEEMSENLQRLVGRIQGRKEEIRQRNFEHVFTGKPQTIAGPSQRRAQQEEKARERKIKKNEKQFNVSVSRVDLDDDAVSDLTRTMPVPRRQPSRSTSQTSQEMLRTTPIVESKEKKALRRGTVHL